MVSEKSKFEYGEEGESGVFVDRRDFLPVTAGRPGNRLLVVKAPKRGEVKG